MGLDIYLKWKGQNKKDKDNQIIGFANKGEAGYLRSSYNDSGFNNWAKRYISGKDFYWIFGQAGESDIAPTPEEWDTISKRADEALQEAKKAVNMPMLIRVGGYHDVFQNENAILRAFKEHNDRQHPDDFDWYSNHEGEFFFGKNSPTVLAVMTCKGYIGDKDIVLVCKPDEDTHKYYIDLLEKDVPAFIKLGKEKNARIVWSG